MTRVRQQTWKLMLDGSQEVVELVPYSGRLWGAPESFRIGTIERKLEYPAGTSRWRRLKTPLGASIEVGGHEVALTLTTISLSYRAAVRRNVSALKWTLSGSFLGTILGGAALGGGAAAAAQTTLAWLIYELCVDNEPSGSWVAKSVDTLVEGWTFVPAGGPLPDSQTINF